MGINDITGKTEARNLEVDRMDNEETLGQAFGVIMNRVH